MRTKALSLALLLLMAMPAWAQHKLSLPETVTGKVGKFIAVTADTPAKSVVWISTSENLDVFPLTLADPKATVVIADQPGKFKLWVVACVGDVQAKAFVWVVVEGIVPPLPPVPPGPNPPVPPGPLPPAPVSGAAVLILYDSAKVTAMPAAQQAILFEVDVRQYLDSKWPLGPDGKTKEWRIWDASVDATNDPSVALKAALARPHPSLPWIVVSNGRAGYEGPLPATAADALVLLKKYGE